MTAGIGCAKFIDICKTESIKTILDIGCGITQDHTNQFKAAKFQVDTNDFFPEMTYQGKYTEINFGKQYDAIWTAHVLEHQENVQLFLRKIYADLKDGGILGVTVPPLKHNIVGGHVNLFNKGLLFYHLVLAGFDCSKAYHKQYGYNITAIVKKTPIQNFPTLNYDTGDIELLAKYFPFKAIQGFAGDKILCNF